jgi:hypothetical protein
MIFRIASVLNGMTRVGAMALRRFAILAACSRRFLTKRIEAAEVVDPEAPRAGQAATRTFFGATVRYANAAGAERVVSIVGTDGIASAYLRVRAGVKGDCRITR